VEGNPYTIIDLLLNLAKQPTLPLKITFRECPSVKFTEAIVCSDHVAHSFD
jgi:hypothetical protein